MAHAHCVLDNKGQRHTLRICNTYIAILQQQWLREHTSVLRYTYIVGLVIPLFWPLMTSSGKLGWDYETDELVFSPLSFYAADHSRLSQAVFLSEWLTVIVIHIMNHPPFHIISFILCFQKVFVFTKNKLPCILCWDYCYVFMTGN